MQTDTGVRRSGTADYLKYVRALVIAALLVAAAAQFSTAGTTQASNVQLFISQTCSTAQPGQVAASFSWQGNEPTARQQWLDLSLSDNGWQPGTFLGTPLSGPATSFNWDGIIAGRAHYVRVNQQLPNGSWDPSATFVFTTVFCADPGPTARARSQLSTLMVMAPAPMMGYSRAQFGPAWDDVDDNSCDTRNDILRRDLINIVLRMGSTCIVERGTLLDPYTGRTIAFVRGVGTSSAVQIDHVVALGATWRTGAATWAPEKRLQLANDPLVLLAVDGPTNGSKSDRDAASWLPPNVAFHCAYVERQIAIKAKYSLWVTPPERDALTDVLADCDDASLNPGSGPLSPVPSTPTASGSSSGAHTWYTSAAATASVYYCELDAGWKNLSPANLRSFSSVEALLAAYPNRTKSITSKC